MRDDDLCDEAPAMRVDWSSTIKLAVVVSVLAAITAVTLAGRVAEPLVIVGVILVGSALGWHHTEQLAVRPAPVRHPRRG